MRSLLSQNRVFLLKLVNLCALVAVLAGFSIWAAQAQAADAAVQQQITETERAANRGPFATDGVFTGSAQGYGGPVNMQVTIENGYIEDVQVVSAPNEDAPYLSQAVALLDVIKQQQTVNVDTVSGCTYSSVGILNGTKEALEKSNAGQASEGSSAAAEDEAASSPDSADAKAGDAQ